MVRALNSKFSVQRSILTRRYSWQYDLTLPSSDLKGTLSKIKTALEPYLSPDSIIKNVKGRDRLNVISQKLDLPFEHELLACELEWDADKYSLVREDPCNKIPCNFYLISPFHHFEGSDIYHKVTQSVTGDTPEQLTLKTILEDSRLTLKSFRLGTDIFGQNSFANWFISAPAVMESLLIESDLSQFNLRIQSEGHKVLSEGMYDNGKFIAQLLSQVGLAFNVEIEKDLKSHLEAGAKPPIK